MLTEPGGPTKLGPRVSNAMNVMKELLRFVARIVATPILFFAFGLFALGGVCFIGPVFQILSFLQGEPFDWGEHLADCKHVFLTPLSIWPASARAKEENTDGEAQKL
jgi:hypothetical protein